MTERQLFSGNILQKEINNLTENKKELIKLKRRFENDLEESECVISPRNEVRIFNASVSLPRILDFVKKELEITDKELEENNNKFKAL